MGYTFISGATGGIGKAFVYECAKNGYDLFITGRSDKKLAELKEELLKEYKIEVICFACDLTKEQSRKDMIDYLAGQKVVLDRIINVAGVDTQMGFMEYTLDKVLFQIRVNAEATVSLTHQLLQHKAERLELITISSLSGASPMPYFALYSATKAMLTNFFTSMHYELKKDGVKVTTVLPGGVPTRPDIIKDIEGQGIWGKLSSKPASFVARKALKKVRRNKVKYIPGFFNKVLNFLMKLVPNCIKLRFIANRWKKISKDAF